MIIVLAAVLSLSMIRLSVNAATREFAVSRTVELAEITGRIRDLDGHAVAGLKISLRNWFGSDLASAVTDENGVFDLRNLKPGHYHCNFRPLGERSRGETVILDLPARRVQMNLTVNRNPSALARAAGKDPYLA